MYGLPLNASAHGHEIDFLILIVHILMVVLFVGWGIYFVIALFKFNKSKNPKADYQGIKGHPSTYIEVAVVLAEVVLLVGFSIPFWAKQVNAFPDRTDTVEVRVVAEQFAWNIHYPGKDGIFGKTDPKLMDRQTNPLGIDNSDPNAKDDFYTINQLHLPIGQPAVLHLSSKDVIHSFSINAMRVKQDTIPGLKIQTWFTPTKTGKFEISCAQLCGIGHYKMRGFLTVHTKEEFDQWAGEQDTFGSSDESGSDDFWN